MKIFISSELGNLIETGSIFLSFLFVFNQKSNWRCVILYLQIVVVVVSHVTQYYLEFDLHFLDTLLKISLSIVGLACSLYLLPCRTFWQLLFHLISMSHLIMLWGKVAGNPIIWVINNELDKGMCNQLWAIICALLRFKLVYPICSNYYKSVISDRKRFISYYLPADNVME